MHKSILNQTFDKLTAIAYLGKSLYLCECKCGTKKPIHARHLKDHSTRSCGCIKAKDLTNQTFDKLTALKRDGSKCGYVTYLCKCECGNERPNVRSDLLRKNITKSCGKCKNQNAS